MFSSTQSKDPHYLSGFTRYYTHNHSSLVMFSSTQSKDPHYLTGFTRYYTHNHSSLVMFSSTQSKDHITCVALQGTTHIIIHH